MRPEVICYPKDDHRDRNGSLISGPSRRLRRDEMQLGHENSSHLRPLAGPRLSDRALRFGDFNQMEDPRSSQLDLRISGESPSMRSLKALIFRAADCNSTILITGESAQEKN